MDMPECHIVPSKILAETIAKEYQIWLHTPGKKGQQHNDTDIRNFYDKEDRFLNKWEYLGNTQR